VTLAALLSAVCVPAEAQLFARTTPGFDRFGVIDAGLAVTSAGAPDSPRRTQVMSGIESSSRFALRNVEDLGRGLRLQMVLEMGFHADTGTLMSYAGNYGAATVDAPTGPAVTGLFNRRAVVGLWGRLGTLSAGRDYTPLYWAVKEGDAFDYGMFGNLQSAVPSIGTGELLGRISNGVFYKTPRSQGVMWSFAYSFGSESPGDLAGAPPRHANEFVGTGFDYRSGRWVLTGSYHKLKYAQVAAGAYTGNLAEREDRAVAGSYNFGSYSVHAGHFQMGEPVNLKDSWFGMRFNVSTNGKLFTQVQRLEQQVGTEDRIGHVYGVGYLYTFSRRTALYATWGETVNEPNASFALATADGAVLAAGPGAKPRGVAIGLRHSF
jgi:predicted porin